MKYFLAKFILHDGEHESIEHCTVAAPTEAKAAEVAQSQEHDGYPEDDEHLTFFDYGDGETACSFKGLREITKEQAILFDEMGVSYAVNCNLRKVK